MEKIFVFGTSTSGETFTDREKETARLVSNFTHGINTFIISPRRWGKTSLVKKAAEEVTKKEKCLVVHIDAFMCRSEVEFLKTFPVEVIKQTSNRWEEWMSNAREFLSRLSPKFQFGTDPMNDFSFSFDMTDSSNSIRDILDLPQRIATMKKRRVVVCIDEFQQIAEFPDSKNFQKKLRSVWQLQDMTTYCLFGSKMHIMSGLFSKQSMPFYKFGDVLFLNKIPEKEWIDYICSRFEAGKKKITTQLASKICQHVSNHSSYVQQLAWLVWLKTDYQANEHHIEEALTDLLEQNSMFYSSLVENLTTYQLNFLRAMIDGVTEGFSTSAVLAKYNLGTSSNVARIRKSLEDKEIVDLSGKTVNFLDPVFSVWLKRELGL